MEIIIINYAQQFNTCNMHFGERGKVANKTIEFESCRTCSYSWSYTEKFLNRPISYAKQCRATIIYECTAAA